MLKNGLIIIIIAQRVYDLKIEIKFPRKKKEHIEWENGKKLFLDKLFSSDI